MSEFVTNAIRAYSTVREKTYSTIDKTDWDNDEIAQKAKRHFNHMPDYSVPVKNNIYGW